MKTPEKIYLQTEDDDEWTWCESSVNNSDTCYIRYDLTFTKEQVIELMKEAWDWSWIHANKQVDLEFYLDFDEWLQQEKPFDSK